MSYLMERSYGFVSGILVSILAGCMLLSMGWVPELKSEKSLLIPDSQLASYCLDQKVEQQEPDGGDFFRFQRQSIGRYGTNAKIGVVENGSATWLDLEANLSQYSGYGLQVSPTGEHLAFNDMVGGDLIILDHEGQSTKVSFLRSSTGDSTPKWITWSSDGTMIAFVFQDEVLISNLAGDVRTLSSNKDWSVNGPLHWSSDGLSILFAADEQSGLDNSLVAADVFLSSLPSKVIFSTDENQLNITSVLEDGTVIFESLNQRYAYARFDSKRQVIQITDHCME